MNRKEVVQSRWKTFSSLMMLLGGKGTKNHLSLSLAVDFWPNFFSLLFC